MGGFWCLSQSCTGVLQVRFDGRRNSGITGQQLPSSGRGAMGQGVAMQSWQVGRGKQSHQECAEKGGSNCRSRSSKEFVVTLRTVIHISPLQTTPPYNPGANQRHSQAHLEPVLSLFPNRNTHQHGPTANNFPQRFKDHLRYRIL